MPRPRPLRGQEVFNRRALGNPPPRGWRRGSNHSITMETHDDDDGMEPIPSIKTPGCAVALILIAGSAATGITAVIWLWQWLAL